MPTKPPQIDVAPASTGSSPVLPPMDRTLRDALEADIVARGIICPIIVSSDGQILDGRFREEIGKRHGLFVPRVVVGCLDSEEKIDIRLVLNGLRRQLSQVQWREIVAWELRRAPERSDRSIAGLIGVSHNKSPPPGSSLRAMVRLTNARGAPRLTAGSPHYELLTG